MPDFDLILAGGGLANGLIALRLAERRPELRVAVVESAPTFGGNHTWSSFDGDLEPETLAWVRPLQAHRWPAYDIRFPAYARTLPTGYASATSALLDARLREAVPADCLLTDAPIAVVQPERVVLADQRVLTARGVIDARGQRPSPHLDVRAQKFLGVEVTTAEPHGIERPVIMDATVSQLDGYRFVYLLPFGPRELLIEDTYYSDAGDLPVGDLRARIRDYAAAQGWTIERWGREEVGVLPVALGGDIGAMWDEGEPGVPMAGLRAALFHPTTGYSFPDAARLADLVAGLPSLDAATLYRAVREHSETLWRQRAFYRMLNMMLFNAATPSERYRVLQHFYRIDDRRVRRFYAGESTLADRARILIGKPPVPVGRAVSVLMQGRWR